MRDLHNNINASLLYVPVVIASSGTTNGPSVDLQSLNAQSLDIQAFSGARTDGTYTFDLYESDDNSTFTAVADADLIGDPAANVISTANALVRFGYIGSKRYIRLSVVAATVTSGALVGALLQQGDLAVAPSDTYYGSEA